MNDLATVPSDSKTLIILMEAYELPDGVGVVEVPYDGTWEDFKNSPKKLCYMDRDYYRASHNSDTFRITYRTDAAVMFARKVRL